MVDVWWYGQACFRIKGKNSSLVIDPFDPNFIGISLPKLEAGIVCVTHQHGDHNNTAAVKEAEEGKEPFLISGPGEYEIEGTNIVGVPSFHDDKNGQERGKNTIYSITMDDINIVHLGDLGQKKLTQDQVEILQSADILMIPVGGVYTIEAKDAPDIIAQIEPKIVIPMHYKIEGLKVELEGVSKFLSNMGKENLTPQTKLSVSRDRLPQETEIVLLEKQ